MTISPLVIRESAKSRFITLEDDFNKVHLNKYEYSKSVYAGANNKIIIICNIHGEFTQTPSDHLRGRGCRKCAGKYKPTLDEFITKAREIHLNKYDYSNYVYKSKDTPSTIICNTCGVVFQQSPHNHVYHKKGCKVCADKLKRAKYFNRPTILYYVTLKYNDTIYYKIGITTWSVKKRFKGDMKFVIDSKEKWFESGEEAYCTEQFILSKYKEYQYTGIDFLYGGNSEIFTKDIWENISDYFLKDCYGKTKT